MNAHAPRSLEVKRTKQILMVLVLAVAVLLPSWAQAAALPVVDNATGASNVQTTSTVLNGTLTLTAGLSTEVRVYWGTVDGGTTILNWGHASVLGTKPVGPLSLAITNLLPNQKYYYRFYATNLAGAAWAGATANFTTLAVAGPLPVNLGSTAHFTILAGAAVTTTGGGIITGDVGASPIAGSAILIPPSQVIGTIYAVDATGTQAANVVPNAGILLTAAKGDLTIAYNDAAGRTPVPTGPFLNPGPASSGNIGGLNLVPGLYKFTSTALITGADVTLTGGPDDVWIFQIAADLQLGSGIKVILAGGARAKNIFWQVGTSAVLGTSSVFKGTIMADQSVTMNTSSTIEGRALARVAGVTFNGTGGTVPSAVNAPVAAPNAYSTTKDTPLIVAAPTGVLPNDSDAAGNPLTAIKLTNPLHGTLTAFNADGSFTYEPNLTYTGPDSFTYKANNGTLDSNIVTVSFNVIPTYTLSVVNGTGDGTYPVGTTVIVTADLPPVGKVFDQWTGDIGYLADAFSASTIATILDANVTVTAGYKNPPVETFILAVNGGTGGGAYPALEVVTVIATPQAGKVFVQWDGDFAILADRTSATTIATMPAAPAAITAIFADAPPATYTLTVVGGTGQGAYPALTIVTIIATPQAGKVFDKWAGDIGYITDPAAATTIVTMPEQNIAVTAMFIDAPPATSTLTVVGGTGGGAYPALTVVTIIATPQPGKVFVRWDGDFAILADRFSATTTATMPATPVTVAAIFTDAPAETFTLTVVNGTGSGAYEADEEVEIVAVSVPAGQVFVRWDGDFGYLADRASATTTATMPDKNITVIAIFNAEPPWYPRIPWLPVANYAWYNLQIWDGVPEAVDANNVLETNVPRTGLTPEREYLLVGSDGLLPGNYFWRYRTWVPETDTYGRGWLPVSSGGGASGHALTVGYGLPLVPSGLACTPPNPGPTGNFDLRFLAGNAQGYDMEINGTLLQNIQRPQRAYFMPGADRVVPYNESTLLVPHPVTLVGDDTCTWRVRGFNPLGVSDWSAYSTITVTATEGNVLPQPDAPDYRFMRPTDGWWVVTDPGLDTASIVFEWSAVPGAAGYVMYLASASGVPIMNYEDIGNVTHWPIGSISSGNRRQLQAGTYLWCLIAYNGATPREYGGWNHSPRSPAQESPVFFQVIDDLTAPTIITAIQGVGNTATITWAGGSIADPLATVDVLLFYPGTSGWREALGQTVTIPVAGVKTGTIPVVWGPGTTNYLLLTGKTAAGTAGPRSRLYVIVIP